MFTDFLLDDDDNDNNK